MNSRERLLAAIEHRSVDRLPMMYRGIAETNLMLAKHMGLDSADANWQAMLDRLGADVFSGGANMGRYTRLTPEYVGNARDAHGGSHLDFVWGLVAQQ